MTARRIPSYRKHALVRARVTLNGKTHYLGPYGSPASKEAYKRLVQEWLAHGDRRLARCFGRSDVDVIDARKTVVRLPKSERDSIQSPGSPGDCGRSSDPVCSTHE